MPTSDQRDAVRYDLDVTSAVMDDGEIDTLYTRAAADYPDSTGGQEAWVRLLAIRRLLAGAAKRSDYQQNQSRESVSQVFDHLLRLKPIYEADLEKALATDLGLVRFGALRRGKTRLVEYPEDYVSPDATIDDASRLE